MNSKPSSYQVIARKYRPQIFANIVGQEAIVTTLKNALRFNRLAHAYLFCGCRGTGKTTLARVFAKALNCNAPTEDFEPCNHCSSCIDINTGRSLNVLEIDGASNRGIDDIRQINETIGYAPASGRYKIYIIDEVHMLTKEAFNALLKTLEEPPTNVKFFFATTEPHKILPTIVSRCQRFDLNRITFEILKNKLSWIAQDLNIPCEEDVFSLIANLSEGSLRDAESLFDQLICYADHPITAAKVSHTLGLTAHSVFFALDKAFEEQHCSYAFELANDIFSSGKDLSYFIDNLIDHYRTLLKLKLNGSVAFSSTKLKEQSLASSLLYTEEQCLYILDFLIHWQQQISKTPFKRVSLEMVLLHIIRSKHRMTLPALVKRLVELEQNFSSNESKSSPMPQSLPPNSTQAVIDNDTAEAPSSTTLIQPLQTERLPLSTPIEPLIISTSEKVSENLSLEDALLKKIKEKIESSPLQSVEEKSLSTNEISSTPLPASRPPLILSKSQWEMAATKETQVSSPFAAEETESVPLNEISSNLLTSSSSPLILSKSAESVATTTETQPLQAFSLLDTKESIPSVENIKTSQGISQSRYDTLIRFAAVELEGGIKA